jgi:hypothetical protein
MWPFKTKCPNKREGFDELVRETPTVKQMQSRIGEIGQTLELHKGGPAHNSEGIFGQIADLKRLVVNLSELNANQYHDLKQRLSTVESQVGVDGPAPKGWKKRISRLESKIDSHLSTYHVGMDDVGRLHHKVDHFIVLAELNKSPVPNIQELARRETREKIADALMTRIRGAWWMGMDTQAALGVWIARIRRGEF